MNNTAVIFDMDGVIIDSEPIYMKVDTEFFKSLGVIVPDKVAETFAGSNATQIITEVYTQVGLPFTIEHTKVLHSQYLEENLKLNFKEIFNKDILNFLDMLLDNNIKMAIASSSKRERILKMVEECKITKYFTEIVSGHQFKESKPNPEIYLYTAKALNIEPKNCIVIEDSSKGISAGKSAGMKVFAKKHKSIAVNLNNADNIFFNFNEIKLKDMLL